MSRGLNPEVDGIGCTVGAAPDLADLVSTCYWRTNGGFREYVRRSDGQVVHREALPSTNRIRATSRELEITKQEESTPVETITEITKQKPANLKVGDLRIGMKVHKWTLESLPYTNDIGVRVIDGQCECGFKKPLRVSNLVSHGTRSCGHERGYGSAAPVADAKQESGAAAEASTDTIKTKRAYQRKPKATAAEAESAQVATAQTATPLRSVAGNGISFANLSQGIEAVAALALMIPVGNVEALVLKITEMEAALPEGDLFDVSDFRKQIEQGKRTAQTFLEFRKQLVEA